MKKFIASIVVLVALATSAFAAVEAPKASVVKPVLAAHSSAKKIVRHHKKVKVAAVVPVVEVKKAAEVKK